MVGVALFLGAALILAFPFSSPRDVYQDQGVAVSGPIDGYYVDSASYPTVLQLVNGTYMMWYTSINHYSRREVIRVAISLDGSRWFPMGVALTGSQSPWNLTEVTMPTALPVSPNSAGSEIDLWFLGLANGSRGFEVYHARGDGFNFAIDGVAIAPENGTFFANGIWGPSVVPTQTGYRMYFFFDQVNATGCGAGCPTSTQEIGAAESAGPLGFRAIGDGPVLTPGPPGAWDSDGVSVPYVTQAFGGWSMYYEGNSGGGGSLGVATSADGISWTKSPDNPVLAPTGSPDAWNGYCICGSSVAAVSHRPVLYYSGFGRDLDQGAIGIAPLVTVSVPLWPVPPFLSGFLLGTALSTAVAVPLLHPWARKRRVEGVLPEADDGKTS